MLTKSLASSLIRPDLDKILHYDPEAHEAHERQTPGNLDERHEAAFDLRAGTFSYVRSG